MNLKKYVKTYHPNGVLQYEGMTLNGEPYGFGKAYYSNGNLQYEGELVNGRPHGKGTHYDEDGTEIYSGEFINGSPADDAPNNTNDSSDDELEIYNVPYSEESNEDAAEDSNGIEKYIGDLNSLIGLTNVKKDLNNLINFVRMQKIRQKQGLKIPALSLHMVFTGNPGTGKTTVARLISKIYSKLGYLTKGHLIETDRSGLVGGYVGQTALKTEEIVKKAIGGVLFIDEAYSLSSDSDDYGQEAINTLLKLMEDYRNDLVVIVAGYPDLMKKFIDSNPGLASRFNRYINFEDYTESELYKIFESFCKKNSYKLDAYGSQTLKYFLHKLYVSRYENFGNARTVRNIFERCIIYQSNRIMELEELPKDLSCLTKEDIEKCFEEEF